MLGLEGVEPGHIESVELVPDLPRLRRRRETGEIGVVPETRQRSTHRRRGVIINKDALHRPAVFGVNQYLVDQ